MKENEKYLDGIKIALIVPPVSQSSFYSEWDLSAVDSTSPPVGLLSIAAIIRDRGGVPSIHDAYARKMSIEETISEVLHSNPDVIGITCVTPQYSQAAALVKRFKQNLPLIPVIMGGAHITALSEKVMEALPELDFGVLREGEITIIELLHAIKNKCDFSSIEGILYRSSGIIHKTKDRDFIQNLDILPPPAWDLLPSLTRDYRLTIVGTKSNKATSLLTSRGCPGQCTFCDVGGVGRKVRYFSAEYVIKMIEYLMTNYGINDFLIYDDNFVTLKSRTEKICEEIINRKLKIHWSCSARIDMVSPDILKLMRKAGCWQIEYGIESGSQKILDLMQKRISLEQIKRALKWTKKAGIETRGNFIFGFLGETRETLEESINFAMKIDLDYYQQTFLTPFPGSEIYNIAKDYGDFDYNFEKMNNFVINFVPKGLTVEELKRYSSTAFKKFYLRPRIILHHLKKIKDIKIFIRLFYALMAFVKTAFLKKT